MDQKTSHDALHKLLLAAFAHSNRAMLARTRTLGLMPGQPKVLEHLATNDGCTQQDVARACVMDKSTVTSIVGRMVDAGLIERRAQPHDRRATALFLTQEGRSAADAVLTFGAQVDEVASQAMSPTELEQLTRLLERVIDNFAQNEREEVR